MKLQKKKQLAKRLKKSHRQTRQAPYIEKLTSYGQLFADVPEVKFLINNVLESDHLIKNGLLPQQLPQLLLPDDIQDRLYRQLASKYPAGNPAGDKLWDRYTAALPKVDRLLRNYRDYLEETYGMWSYTNAPFIAALSDYLAGQPVLEIMAGNGYISRGLRQHNPHQHVITTDSKAWVDENQTGRHPVTTVEKCDALAAIKRYGHEVRFVIMSWSPDKVEIDWQVLQLIRQGFPHPQLLVVGEKNGATNSARFWKEATLSQAGLEKVNQHLQTFDLIDEQVYLAK
ncbi:SAM-dependent methyltransferase [uncultured Limosilactobacillus sp.]|uniref:SAM-dependent methyltransferase n=1 Tax=uncultured Limosilactobacillus sp. TaxID=2837629 RepID=UPI0025EABFA9|nr:SAM-dependent methyltransferase [uncultured Limosilactobacillus sp.]